MPNNINSRVIDEIVVLNVGTATIGVNNHNNRKFAALCSFIDGQAPVGGYIVVDNIPDLEVKINSAPYYKKWFEFGGEELTLIDINSSDLVAVVDSVPAYNIIYDALALPLDQQISTFKIIEGCKRKYHFMTAKRTEVDTYTKGMRNVAINFDHALDGGVFEYLVKLQTPYSYPMENYEPSLLPAPTELDDTYVIGNLEKFYIDNTVSGIFYNPQQGTDMQFYNFDRANMPIVLNFLREDIALSQQLAIEKVLVNKRHKPNNSLVAKIVTAMELDMDRYKDIYGMVTAYKCSGLPASQQPEIKAGITNGYVTTYKTFISPYFADVGVKETV